jgi:uncharacterized protein YdgA (DUF945 family)
MKSARSLLIALAVLAVVYLGLTWYTGQRVETESIRLAAALAERDDVRVTRFEYERGFAGGQLHYDLTWQPMPDDTGADTLREAGLLPAEGFRLAGVVQVRHGPWTGSTGFAAASTEGTVPLPDEARPFLPQYPGQVPLLHVSGVLTFGGRIELHARALDYHGRLDVPEIKGSASLVLNGLHGTVTTVSTLDRIALDLRMKQLGLEIKDLEGVSALSLEGLHAVADMHVALPRLWAGTTDVGLERLGLTLPDQAIEIRDSTVKSDTWLTGETVHSTTRMDTGRIAVGDYALRSVHASAALRDVDAMALVEMTELTDRIPASPEPEAAEAYFEQLLGLMERILAGGPTFAIEQLSVALTEPEDLTGRLSLTVEGAPRLSLEALEEIARALRLDAGFRLRKAALRQAIGLAMSEQLPADATPEQRELELDAMYAQTLAGFEMMPFLTITDEHIGLEVKLNDGTLLVGGMPLMEGEDIAAWMLSTMIGGLDTGHAHDHDHGPGGFFGDFPMMDHTAEPLFGRVELAADFVPDPFNIPLEAGGAENLEMLVGHGCVGWVNASQPDVVVNYSAGEFPLFMFVTAEDDTTLAVRDPDGRWFCNDDAFGYGFNPGVEFTDPASGDYAVWVGTYAGEPVDAIFTISEIGMGRLGGELP